MNENAKAMTPTLKQLTELADANRDGKSWYADASSTIRSVCQLENWNVEYFTGILAVTSPRCAVRRNVRIALQYCGDGRVLQNVMRSIRRSIEIFDSSREIRGPKTSAFYAALTGDHSAVVLDVHMANLLGVSQRTAFRGKQEIAYWGHIVRVIGKRLGMTGRECQACLWFGHKRNVGEYPEPFPLIAEYGNWLRHGKQFPNDGYIDSDFGDTF